MLAWINCNVFIFNWLLGDGWVGLPSSNFRSQPDFPSMAILILCVSSDFTFSNTHKIINTDTCMPRGGPNYKLVFCPQLHNIYIYIYLITFFSSTTYQPTYLTKRGTTFFGGTSPNKLQVQHPSGRFCWKSLFPAQRRRCCSRPMAWLVVWNIFLCFHILGIRLPFD